MSQFGRKEGVVINLESRFVQGEVLQRFSFMSHSLKSMVMFFKTFGVIC